MTYIYDGNNIIHYHFITGERITDWTHVSKEPEFDEDWSQDSFRWHWNVIWEMAEEFHDLNKFSQLPNNLQEWILESKRVMFDARTWIYELDERDGMLNDWDERPVLEEIIFGNLEKESDFPERVSKAWNEMIDEEIKNMIEEEQMWDEIQIKGVLENDSKT